MKTPRISFIVLFALLISSSCKDENIQPHESDSKVTAEIDGKFWEAKTQNFSGPPIVGGLDGEYFNIAAFNTYQGFDTELRVVVFNVTDTGTFVLNNEKPGRGSWKDNNKKVSWHFTDSLVTGMAIINKLDRENRHITGTFHFDALNSNKETVKVRNGTIDLKY